MVSSWELSHKSRCSQYTRGTCPKINALSYPPNLPPSCIPDLCKSKSSDPVAQGRSPGVIPDATLPLASNIPSILLELLTTFLTPSSTSLLLSCNHCLLSSPLLLQRLPFIFHLSPFPSPSLSIPPFSPPYSHQNGPGSKCDLIISLLEIPHFSVYAV